MTGQPEPATNGQDACLIWSNEHGAWWAPRSLGYTTIIDAAGRYPRAEAQRIVDNASLDGQLTVTREDPCGVRRVVAPEVVVTAPEGTSP